MKTCKECRYWSEACNYLNGRNAALVHEWHHWGYCTSQEEDEGVNNQVLFRGDWSCGHFGPKKRHCETCGKEI